MGIELKYKELRKIYEIDKDQSIFGVVKYKKISKLNNNTDFVKINRACRKAKILTKDLFERSEKAREMRNKIHLTGLEEIDDLYNKKDVNYVFTTARKILDRIEAKLLNIRENSNQ